MVEFTKCRAVQFLYFIVLVALLGCARGGGEITAPASAPDPSFSGRLTLSEARHYFESTSAGLYGAALFGSGHSGCGHDHGVATKALKVSEGLPALTPLWDEAQTTTNGVIVTVEVPLLGDSRKEAYFRYGRRDSLSAADKKGRSVSRLVIRQDSRLDTTVCFVATLIGDGSNERRAKRDSTAYWFARNPGFSGLVVISGVEGAIRGAYRCRPWEREAVRLATYDEVLEANYEPAELTSFSLLESAPEGYQLGAVSNDGSTLVCAYCAGSNIVLRSDPGKLYPYYYCTDCLRETYLIPEVTVIYCPVCYQPKANCLCCPICHDHPCVCDFGPTYCLNCGGPHQTALCPEGAGGGSGGGPGGKDPKPDPDPDPDPPTPPGGEDPELPKPDREHMKTVHFVPYGV